MTTDPVCGMDIDEKEAAGSEEYGGTTYHFCSKACQETFRNAPERYAESKEGD
jgi:YHS domain-containing protein